MPLYMDIHLLGDGFSLEDARKAHMRDVAVQEKYNVMYHQYWLNEETGTAYCLMEGPDKESCAAIHREANGFEACQIVEVEGGLYDLLMDKNQKLDHGLVRHDDGKIDTGYRYILTLDIIAKTRSTDSIDFDQLKLPTRPINIALRVISEFDGKEVRTGGYDSIIAVFIIPENALRCAHKIQKEFLNLRKEKNPDNDYFAFNMGISVGQPLTETEGFFVEAIRMSHRLCLIAGEDEIITLRIFEELCDMNATIKKHISLRAIKPSEQEFLDQLLDIVENHISDHEFGVDYLSRDMGVRRPQLYRKVTAITGRSPVTFIRDIRLNKALSLIKENKYNLSEIALEIGYNSPSYFSKCFRDKYGVKASGVAV
jgi:AraC-like DNA-binding protein